MSGPSSERAAVDALLASRVFSRAPNLARILSYICSKVLEGAGDQITEYGIARDALGRPMNFDPGTDAIVRVEMHRLRKRLEDYYSTEGTRDPVQIALPHGSYAPLFLTQSLNPDGNGRSGNLVGKRVASTLLRWFSTLRPRALLSLCTELLLHLDLRSPTSSALQTKSGSGAGGNPSVLLGQEVRILVGSPVARYVDRLGNTWGPDRYFRGGVAQTSGAHPVFRAADPFIFQARREGNFSYRIPVVPGTYRLHLYFAEAVFGPQNLAGGGEGSRVFDIALNGKPLLRELDIISDAGGSNIAVEKILDGVSPAADGHIQLDFFSHFSDRPILNALAVVPIEPGGTPVRIICQDISYTDHDGRCWGADRFYMGGQPIARPEPVSAADPHLFKGERYGNFTYAIAVVPRPHTVTLKFSERWFGPDKPAGGGVGSRVFNVTCNGVLLLKDFDIFKAAGGGDRELSKTFRGLDPDAQGKLVLGFLPVVNYATVNAVEALPERPHWPARRSDVFAPVSR
jgi:hypothetical protein